MCTEFGSTSRPRQLPDTHVKLVPFSKGSLVVSSIRSIRYLSYCSKHFFHSLASRSLPTMRIGRSGATFRTAGMMCLITASRSFWPEPTPLTMTVKLGWPSLTAILAAWVAPFIILLPAIVCKDAWARECWSKRSRSMTLAFSSGWSVIRLHRLSHRNRAARLPRCGKSVVWTPELELSLARKHASFGDRSER